MGSRRQFIGVLGAAAAAIASDVSPRVDLCVFTKHLQFLSGDALADAIAEIGVEGADLSLRKGGHVEPSRVRQDLPLLIRALEKRGLRLTMATTDVVDAESPYAEDVLAALAEHGVTHYRWGGFKFDPMRPIVEQIEALKPRVRGLEELNRRHGVCAMYHTHSGLNQIGAAIWDLRLLLKDFDPKYVAVNYDIGHATVEGGFGGWIESLNVTGPYLRGVALKDFLWVKNPKGEWRPEWRPVGEGMVPFDQFFATLKRVRFAGPMQIHYEYAMGGAENGSRHPEWAKDRIIASMKRDATRIKALWAGSS